MPLVESQPTTPKGVLAHPHVRRRDVLDIPMAMTDYEGTIGVMESMIDSRTPGWICASSVHSLVVAQRDPGMRRALTEATLTVPDGMPIVWAAKSLGEHLDDRVYGPELMDRFCARAAQRGDRVWLYGGRDDATLASLTLNLRERHDGIDIVGGHSPPFRELTPDEEDALVAQINHDRPDVLWVGIGVPKQEKWMVRMRDRLEVPVMCAVGAAFDFHAGRVSQAPRWMQRRGLEWVYRIAQEPRRLLPRYLYTNPYFVLAFARQAWRERGRARR